MAEGEKQNDIYDTYNRYQYYEIIYDELVSGYRIGKGYENLPEYPQQEGDIFYVVEGRFQFRPDLLSLEYYGTTKLWWVIMRANNFDHPAKDLEAGTTIRIPDPERVLGEE